MDGAASAGWVFILFHTSKDGNTTVRCNGCTWQKSKSRDFFKEIIVDQLVIEQTLFIWVFFLATILVCLEEYCSVF